MVALRISICSERPCAPKIVCMARDSHKEVLIYPYTCVCVFSSLSSSLSLSSRHPRSSYWSCRLMGVGVGGSPVGRLSNFLLGGACAGSLILGLRDSSDITEILNATDLLDSPPVNPQYARQRLPTNPPTTCESLTHCIYFPKQL